MAYPDSPSNIIYWEYDGQNLDVCAELPDTKLEFAGTYYDPPEYGPGLGKISLDLDYDLEDPAPETIRDEKQVFEILNEQDPEYWILFGDPGYSTIC